MFFVSSFTNLQEGLPCNCLNFNCFYTDTKIEWETDTKNGLKKDLMVFFSAILPKLF
jgi:hypothetical protein